MDSVEWKNILFNDDYMKMEYNNIMNNFNLIENTKSRNSTSDILMAGGLAGSMLLFMMK